MGNYNNNFFKNLQFNPQEILNPKVCQGDNFIPNILKSLGGNENILKNPRALVEIEAQFISIVKQSGLSMPNHYEQPTRKQIESIVEAIKENMEIFNKERDSKYNENYIEPSQQFYYGLNIDKKTGNINLGKLNYSSIKDKSFTSDTFIPVEYVETSFTMDGDENIVLTKTHNSITPSATEMPNCKSRLVLNSDGITIESEDWSYEQKDEENIVNYHRLAKRDFEYPFIFVEKILENDLSADKFKGTRFVLNNFKNLTELSPEYQKDENGTLTIKPVTFDSRKQIAKYYNENKETITNAFMQNPECQLFQSKFLNPSLTQGIKKLAYKSGILSSKTENKAQI